MTDQTADDTAYEVITELAAGSVQQRLLEIITDPANDETGAITAPAANTRQHQIDELSEFGGYEGTDDVIEAQQVADRLRCHYDRNRDSLNGTGAFCFGIEASTEHDLIAYFVGITLDTDIGYLTTFSDLKHITTDRHATGLQAALGYAEALDGDYQRLWTEARDHGLLPDANGVIS